MNRKGKVEKISDLFCKLGQNLIESGVVNQVGVHEGHDVQAYLRLDRDPSKIIHIQAYPGFSSWRNMMIVARLMDYDRLMEIRKEGYISIGNEHEAAVKRLDNFEVQRKLPYNPKVLEEKLAEDVPELRV